MKNTFTFTLFLFLAAAWLFYGNSGGAGSVQGVDRTGSPLSPGSCNENGCHTDNSFSPSVELVLLSGENEISEYEPGETYRMRFTVTPGTGTPAGYGFQAVALSGEDNVNAGTWGDEPDGVQVIEINDRFYVEHSERSGSNVFEIDWTAPSGETGPVRFYAAGNAVNGNGNNSGDGAVALAEPVLIPARSAASFARIAGLDVEMKVWPNPAIDHFSLLISKAEAGHYEVSIADLQGRILNKRPVQLRSGENRELFDISRLETGHYFVRLSDGKRVASRKLLKF